MYLLALKPTTGWLNLINMQTFEKILTNIYQSNKVIPSKATIFSMFTLFLTVVSKRNPFYFLCCCTSPMPLVFGTLHYIEHRVLLRSEMNLSNDYKYSKLATEMSQQQLLP